MQEEEEEEEEREDALQPRKVTHKNLKYASLGCSQLLRPLPLW